MTVSTSIGREFNVATIAGTAYKLAGLVNVNQLPSAAQVSFAQLLLDTILDGLQAEGISARATVFENVQLSPGEYKYSLSDEVLDIVGSGMYISPSETDLERANGETSLRQVSQEQWQTTSSKSASGRPSLYFVYRAGTPVQAWLWPVPDESGTVRFQVHRKLADTDAGAATLDLELYWNQFVLWELAHQLALASSLPVSRCAYFAGEAHKKKEYAKSMARPQVNNQMLLTHSVRMSRY